MKKLVSIIFIGIFVTSCQIREEMTIHKDGSGEYRLGIDVGSMIKAMNEMKKDTVAKVDVKSQPEESIDSLIPVDYFYQKAKDSIQLTKEEEKAFEEMKGLMMHIKMDKDAGIMKFEYIYPYKKMNQLNNFFQNLKLINEVEKKYKEKKTTETNDMINELGKYKVNYSFKRKIFKRKTISLNKKEGKAEAKEEKKGLDKLSDFFQYEIVYHFPYPIKKVKYKGEAKMSADRKTLYIKVPVDELDDNPKLLDFEVILE